MGYTKLFNTIVTSTVWRESDPVRIVWITMLALADRDGVVEASVPGLADTSHVSLDNCITALQVLSGPDEWSRTKDHDGRRITPIDGGWKLLNYEKYREKMDADDQREKARVRKQRQRERQKSRSESRSVPQCHRSHDIAKAKAEAKEGGDPSGGIEPVEPEPPPPLVGKNFGMKASEAARAVLTELMISGRTLLITLSEVIDSHARKGQNPEDVAERMIAAYRYHQKTETARGRDPQKPGFFFGDGDWEAWAKKAEASSPGSGQSLRERVDAQLAGGGQ